MLRVGLQAGGRPRSRHTEQRPESRRRRHPAVDAFGHRRHVDDEPPDRRRGRVRFLDPGAAQTLHAGAARYPPARHRQESCPCPAQDQAWTNAPVGHGVRGRRQQPRTPLSPDRVRHDPRRDRAVHVPALLPELSGTATQARGARRHHRRLQHHRRYQQIHRARSRLDRRHQGRRRLAVERGHSNHGSSTGQRLRLQRCAGGPRGHRRHVRAVPKQPRTVQELRRQAHRQRRPAHPLRARNDHRLAGPQGRSRRVCASSTTSDSTTSPSSVPPRPSAAARPSASGSPPR